MRDYDIESRSRLLDVGLGVHGVFVGLAHFRPVDSGPELLQPLLLAPDAIPGAHPSVLINRHAEKRVEYLTDVQEVGLNMVTTASWGAVDGGAGSVDVEVAVVANTSLDRRPLSGRRGGTGREKGGRGAWGRRGGRRSGRRSGSGLMFFSESECWDGGHVGTRANEESARAEGGKDSGLASRVGDKPDPTVGEHSQRGSREARLELSEASMLLVDSSGEGRGDFGFVVRLVCGRRFLNARNEIPRQLGKTRKERTMLSRKKLLLRARLA